MGRILTIKEAEKRHSDLVKGQKWIGARETYKYFCKKHGIYTQIFNNHDQGRWCPKCWHMEGLKRRVAEGMSHTPEYTTVTGHFRFIFSKNSGNKNYVGMPFYDNWNPNKGGSWLNEAKWIIKNLGKRPKGASLHIIEHEKGFIPGNLEWAYPNKQSAQKMFKIIANLKHRIKELEFKLTQERKQ